MITNLRLITFGENQIDTTSIPLPLPVYFSHQHTGLPQLFLTMLNYT